jgi:hypothetical protein
MHLAQLVKRRAAAMQLITQSALALTEHPTLADKARAVASARAKDPQVDTLFKLEAVASLIFEMAYQANPKAFEPTPQSTGGEQSEVVDTPTATEPEEESEPAEETPTTLSTGGKLPEKRAKRKAK